jgi:2',3'-cyclic-nucleotide 2'-phosphodiesterase (5'-nucleotidase family)
MEQQQLPNNEPQNMDMEMMERHKRDLFFVMNGDSVDGTGLSEYPPTHLEPLLQHMPWDAMNIGNHELYHDETVNYLVEQQQPQSQSQSQSQNEQSQNEKSQSQPQLGEWKKGNYLSSNTVLVNDKHQQAMVGNKYVYLEGKHTNTTILTFGFLYDFHEFGSPDSAATNVAVEDAIQQPWFLNVLGPNAPKPFDAILVLAHMDCLDPLVTVILDGIRAALPCAATTTMPIQFVTGHTHRRCHARLDDTAESFEAGRFLDTIGFVSFDSSSSTTPTATTDVDNVDGSIIRETANANNFQHRFWDANRNALHETLVLAQVGEDQKGDYTFDFKTDFGTPDGRALTQAIRTTQADMGLNQIVGCAPKTFGIFESENDHRRSSAWNHIAKPLPLPPLLKHEESLWLLYLEKMLPNQLLAPLHHSDPTRGEPILVSGTGVLRYSLFEGPITVNDVIAISPFNDTIHELESFSAESGAPADASGDGLQPQEQKLLPIYGWQLVRLMEASNRLYAHNGEYGMPTFVLSTLAADDNPIDPGRVYRLFATDYDAARLLSVLSILKQQDETEETTTTTTTTTLPPSITKGRSFQSRQACRVNNKIGSNACEDCYSLTELWKQYILEQMPCSSDLEHHPNNKSSNDNHNSLRWDGGKSNDDSIDASPLLSAAAAATTQILQPSGSATSARVHSRMTPVQEENFLANDQKAALALVVATLALIAYMLVYPPEQNNPDDGQSGNVGRRRQRKSPAIARNPRDATVDNPTTRRENEVEGGVDVQLIPLRRYNTGSLSEGSYGSI